MDTILKKITVDKTSKAYEWIQTLEFDLNGNKSTSSFRDDNINSIIYAACLSLNIDKQIDPGTLPVLDLVNYTYQYVPFYISNLCNYLLMKNGVTVTQDVSAIIMSRIEAKETSMMFYNYMISKFSGHQSTFELQSSIEHLSYDNKDVKPDFIDGLLGDFLPTEENLEHVKSFSSGMKVAGVTLIELISKSDESEIWKGTRMNKIVAVKFEEFEKSGKDLETLLTGKDSKKIISYIKENDEEYINFTTRLKSFRSKIEFFLVDYYNPLNMKVKIMQYLDGPISSDIIEDKKTFILSMINIFHELHSSEHVFGNITKNHIMFSNDGKIRYKLIDYKYVKSIGDVSTLDHGKYRSINLLSAIGDNIKFTPYYDIESFLYVLNDIIMDSSPEYADLNDEIQKKSHLSSFSSIVATAITQLRLLMDVDPDVHFKDVANVKDHINNMYIKGFLNQNDNTHVHGVVDIIKNLIHNFNEIPPLAIDMTLSNKELLKKIREQYAQDPRFNFLLSDINRFNDITIKTLNSMTVSSQYSIEDTKIIEAFLMG